MLITTSKTIKDTVMTDYCERRRQLYNHASKIWSGRISRTKHSLVPQPPAVPRITSTMVAFAQITALLAGAASIASASPTPDLSARQSVAGVQPAFSCPNRTINGHVSPYPLRSLCLKTPLASTKPYYRAGSYYPLRPGKHLPCLTCTPCMCPNMP